MCLSRNCIRQLSRSLMYCIYFYDFSTLYIKLCFQSGFFDLWLKVVVHVCHTVLSNKIADVDRFLIGGVKSVFLSKYPLLPPTNC